MDLDLEELTKAGDPKYRSNLTSDQEEDIELDYSNRVPVAKDIDRDKIIYVDLDDTTRIGAFGQSGSGKTTLAKRLIFSAVIWGDWKAIHGSDVKNDFRTVNGTSGPGEGPSKKLQNETEGLLKGEEGHDVPRVMAVPNFMVDHYQSRPQYGDIFSMNMSDLTESEFKFLSGYHDWDSTAASESLDEIFMKQDFKELSLDMLMAIADREYGNNTLLRKLRGVKNQKLLSSRVDHNLEDIMYKFNDVGVLSLGLKHWRKYLGGQEHFFQFYSGKMVRKFNEMTDSGEIEGDKFIYFMDEAHKLMPKGEESIVKAEYQDFYDLAGRQRGVIPFLSTQRPEQVPNRGENDFISDLSDVFLMRGKTPLKPEQWKPIVSNMGVYNRDGQEQLKKWRAKIQSLDQYEGIYISSTKHSKPEDCPRIRTLCPPVAHPG